MATQCTLSILAETPEPCPQGECAFWQHGGEDIEPGCAVERLQLHTCGIDVADFLLGIRHRLEAERPAAASPRL